LINRNLILFIILVLGLVHIIEALGFEPCDLCLKQRWPWYISLILAIIPNFIFHNKNNYFLLFISLFLFLNSLYAGWHAGIEWGFWEGPQTCTALKNNYSNNLLEVLKSSSSAPQCNEASLRIFGLSLAGYNFIISLMSSLVLLNKVRKVL
tara:strand:- start:3143 stop:3595 length:453 start_codon:yes stop_codon:yes gene_type:complete